MIEVQIQGPLPKKDYERIKTLLFAATEGAISERRVAISYRDRGFNDRVVRLEQKNGAPRIVIETGKIGERTELVTRLAPGSFSEGVVLLAELGYRKGSVSAQEVATSSYGGALFSLVDPGEDAFYYEAVIFAKDPTEAKEAKQKLERIAKQLKLPVWTPLDMLGFLRRLSETTQTSFDFDTDGREYFKTKFGI